MGVSTFFRSLLGLFLFAGYTFCHKCPSGDEESVLQPGHVYTYKFKSEAFAEAVGTTNDRSRMTLECNVEVAHARDCYYNLKMRDCSLDAVGGPPDSERAWISNKQLTELSRYPVSFSLINGAVKEVYSNVDDAIFYVNIKRGALSAFVFKLAKTVETRNEVITDIHGTCPVQYTSISDGHIKASKNMMDCIFPSRPDWQLSPWSIFWNMSFIQYQMNSTVECEYKLNRGEKRLDAVDCKERHAIGLESTHRTATAVQTNIYYHMVHMKSEKKAADAETVIAERRSGIEFEYEHTPEPDTHSQPENFLSLAQKLLSDLVETSQDRIRLFSITQFTDFVALLRTSYDVSPFVGSVRDCSFLTKEIVCSDSVRDLSMAYLSDALVQCQTVACIKAVADLSIREDLTETYVNFVLYSWTNIHFTKPEIITYIMAMCENKDSKFCWLSLGTVIKKFHQATFSPSAKLVDEVKSVVHHFSSSIGKDCEPPHTFTSEQERNEHILTYIKAMGNAGKAFVKYSRRGTFQIMKCAERSDLPMFIRTAALEALTQMKICETSVSICLSINGDLTSMLKNETASVELRLAAYDLLISTPDMYNFENHVRAVLNTDKNSQVLSYVASDLMTRLNDAEYRTAHPNFVRYMTDFLEQDDIQLETLAHYEEEGMSYRESDGSFYRVPFLPSNLQGFGAKTYTSVIFPFYSALPQKIQSGISLKIFNKVIDLLTVGGKFEDWQQVALLIEKFSSPLNVSSSDDVSALFYDILHTVTQHGLGSYDNHNFDENIVNNIKKIYSEYRKHKPSGYPFFDFYLQMLGSTINYITTDDILAWQSVSFDFDGFIERLSNGISYNNTHIIRVIEAYNQVPTLMGLSLNWTTNATLAFSMRQGLKINFEKNDQDNVETHAEGYFQPSAALTFVNRMALDFPTITQIGIQANSSAYTSTQLSAKFTSINGVMSLKIEAPKEPQKILEMFRTNQIIKHNTYADIPDWDIERTSVDWCLEGASSSVLGLQVCHERSYPNVTHRIKPWALMAGSCKWRLELRPYDKNLESYNLEIQQLLPSSALTKYKVKFSAPGSSLKREVAVDALFNAKTGGFGINVAVPDLPEFLVSLSRNGMYENDKFIGFWDVFLLKISESIKYQFTLNQESRTERVKDKYVDELGSTRSKKISTLTEQSQMRFLTPFNEYSCNLKSHTQDENVKVDLLLVYQNHNARKNFLSQILPPIFWENESKASLHMLYSLKSLSDSSKGSSSKQLSGRINTPGSSIDLEGNSLFATKRQQMGLNITRTQVATGKPLSFLKLAYDQWSSKMEHGTKEIYAFNLTIPRRSWSLQMKNFVEGGKHVDSFVVASEKMVPKDDQDASSKDYIGWWSEDMADLFRLEHYKYELISHTESQNLNVKQISSLLGNIEDDEMADLYNRYITADISFRYPFASHEEVVKFDGKFLISASPLVFRFQKDFVLLSSYNNLQLNSHSIYKEDNSIGKRHILHNSFFTNTVSQRKAFYNMELKVLPNPNHCLEVDFEHNITSHVYNMASDVRYKCSADSRQLHVLRLNLDSNSTYWEALNVNIRQIIEDVSPTYSQEKMNLSSPYLAVNVVATWDGDNHQKEALFTSLPENKTLFQIERQSTALSNQLQLIIPYGASERKFLYLRRFSKDFKRLKSELHYPDFENMVFRLYGNILSPENRIWKLELHPGLYYFADFIAGVIAKTSQSMITATANPNHPLNKMLEPSLRMPLMQYVLELEKDMKSSINSAALTLGESMMSLGPFFEPSLTVLNNIYGVTLHQAGALYSAAEKKSIIIWALQYFDVSSNIPLLLQLLPQQYHEHEKGHPLKTFVYHSGKYLNWRAYNEMPTFAYEQVQKQIFSHRGDEMEPYHKPAEGGKLAMLFGPRHVYTFDGLTYEIPEYPSKDCAYLLAHDTYGSMFSAVATADFIHLLFPESSISIGPRNEVFVDRKQKQQSLPFQSKNNTVAVTRSGNVVMVTSSSLTVLCYGQSFLCVLEISSWNGGGTIGLLGNADGEKYNDFMLPDGKLAADVIELARRYELSGIRKCQNLAPKPTRSNANINTKQCTQSVNKVCASYDHLRENFQDHCKSYVESEGNVCYTESALSALCYFNQQDMPTSCNVRVQEKLQVQQKLSVVLVVNQQRSMLSGDRTESNVKKGIQLILKDLEQRFFSNGYTDISYSLVGFGGDGVRHNPSVHSVNSDIWLKHDDSVADLLQTLEFQGTEKFDPVLAVKYAVEVLGRDTFDVKTFIVLTDSDQQTSDKNTVHLVQHHLHANHITLYTIASYPSIEKGKKVFGVRADGLVFPTAEKGEDFLDYPQGDLAKLTSATRGSLFLKTFVDYQAPASYFEELAKEVFAKVRRETQFCRLCKTVRSGWWYYQNECRLVECT